MLIMSNINSGLSSAVFAFNSVSIPKKAAVAAVGVHNYGLGHGHGRRTVTVTHSHCMPPLLSHPSASASASASGSGSGSGVTSSSKDTDACVCVRPITTPTFTPTMWGDVFSNFSFDHQIQQKYSHEIEALKKQVGSMLMSAASAKVLDLIDKLERLALAHHFETEIQQKLTQVYDEDKGNDHHHDLFTTSLRFRLLRQHQYHVSCDVFAKFVDEKDKKLKESLGGDVKGLLSLYEATHVQIPDENFLDEAMAFTRHHLTRLLPQLESQPLLKQEVQQALQLPLHKRFLILTLRSYIDFYESDDSKEETLLRLAKLNFNFMQNIFKNELFQLTTWWKKLELQSKVAFTRDRLVESYIWAFSNGFQPQYSLVRTIMTKLYIAITTLDDTYDSYATLEEIQLLTRAIERWNMEEANALPDNLKEVYKLIISVGEEFAGEAEKKGKSYVVPYFIEQMKELARRYSEEQKWIVERVMPGFETRMMSSRITTIIYVTFLPVVALIESCSKETLDWVLSEPDLLIMSSDLMRLLDDVTTHERESRDGRMVTPLNYYMKERGVRSLEEAKRDYEEMIDEKWKDVNAAWIDCTMIPKEIGVQCLELSRQTETFFIDRQDGFSWPENTKMGPFIAALMLDPIPIPLLV